MTRGYRFANALATKIAGRFSASRLRTKSDRLLAYDNACDEGGESDPW